MTNQSRLEAVAKADAVADLLNHTGWQDIVKPALLKRRTDLTATLVNAVLGQPMPEGVTKEQLAGRVQGIDEIIKLFELILKHGREALNQLESQGFSLTANNL